MAEWIRFGIVAVLMIFGLFCFAAAVLGVWKFGFVMNRVHASGIGDSLGILCIIASLVVASGFCLTSLKLVLIIVFLWFTSPVSAHFLGQVEYFTNNELEKYVKMPGKKEGKEEE